MPAYQSGMANKTTFVVQTFETKRGRLVPGAKDVAPTENGALKRAAAAVPRLPGAAAIKVVADDETGEVSAITVLGTFGDIPEDFVEGLVAG